MNKWFLLSALFSATVVQADPSARDILDRSIHLDRGKSVTARVEIIVKLEHEKDKSKTLTLLKNTVSGEERSRVDFVAPADIKGLALLILDHSQGDTEQHLYTPALRRVRRIRGSLKSQDFADTDFSYEDMERRSLDDADHALESTEPIDGHPCFKIVSTTKKKARSQYGKTVTWVDRDTFLFRRVEFFDHGGEHIKTLTSLRSDQISGIWTQLTLEMENIKKHRKTVYDVQKIEYGRPIDEHVFLLTSLGQ